MLIEILKFCASRELTINQVADPMSEKAFVARESAIVFMAHTLKKSPKTIAYFWSLPIEHVASTLRAERNAFYRPRTMR